jgi:hypothetical protein
MPEAIYNETRFSEIDLLQDLQAILTKKELNEVLAWLSGEDINLSENIIRKLKIYFGETRHERTRYV